MSLPTEHDGPADERRPLIEDADTEGHVRTRGSLPKGQGDRMPLLDDSDVEGHRFRLP